MRPEKFPHREVRLTPHFPKYSEVRHLLGVWPGFLRRNVTGLHSTLQGLMGTPQNTADWTDPETWIPARLGGTTANLPKPSGIKRKVR